MMMFVYQMYFLQLQKSYLNNLGSREKCGKVREKKGEINQKV